MVPSAFPNIFHLSFYSGAIGEACQWALQQLRSAELQQKVVRSASTEEGQEGSKEDQSSSTAVVG